jgi:predicted RNase H-like HicB family nuclease
MRRYLVVFEKTETGYSAYVPDIPGCIATGATRDETEQEVYEALRFYLEGLSQENSDIPEGKADSEVIVIN